MVRPSRRSSSTRAGPCALCGSSLGGTIYDAQRLHHGLRSSRYSSPAMMRSMNSLNIGTINAVSPSKSFPC